MTGRRQIKSALISVYDKTGLDEIIDGLSALNVQIISTGGTQSYIENIGVSVNSVENLTGYPSILGGRVKTLHPKIFGGILAKRNQPHLEELSAYDIPRIDLVIVDLYPFEDTVKSSDDESEIIEKIDIGGISLIRAAAKNFSEVLVISSKNEYSTLLHILKEQKRESDTEQRRQLARKAFALSSHYDVLIHDYFNKNENSQDSLKISLNKSYPLRYGENPHQNAAFYGNLENQIVQLSGKPVSYNNLVDIDAAVDLMAEFTNGSAAFAVLKHTNSCGIAVRESLPEAWNAALAGDPVSAFGGVLICNQILDRKTAEEIDRIFYEVIISPSYEPAALELLKKKKKRIILEIRHFSRSSHKLKSILNGIIRQETDLNTPKQYEIKPVTDLTPASEDLKELEFANICVKHLKSNAIVITKNLQLIGMGCGQTSRVDACRQAIEKAKTMGFELNGAVLASDAFFPFPDCVELANDAGIKGIIQPGGSIKDQLSIDACNQYGMFMVFTGMRHFKH